MYLRYYTSIVLYSSTIYRLIRAKNTLIITFGSRFDKFCFDPVYVPYTYCYDQAIKYSTVAAYP